jgi:hypothetical protein
LLTFQSLSALLLTFSSFFLQPWESVSRWVSVRIVSRRHSS